MKKYKINAEDIKDLIPDESTCFATDHITVDGMKIGFMYREKPENRKDSGWRFFSGTETEEYIDDINNTEVHDLNTIANYDPAIIPHLRALYGTEFERGEGDEFIEEED